MLEAVPQKDAMGCGVACVAFLTRRAREGPGAAYDRALKLFKQPQRVEKLGYPLHMIIAALEEAGLSAKRRGLSQLGPRERLSSIGPRSIIKARRYQDDRWLHYVVFTGSEFVDPLDEGDLAVPWREQRRGQLHIRWPRAWTALSYIEVG